MNRKKLILLILGLAALVGTVSAAVISYFGQVEITAMVKQAVRLDGKDYTTPITEEVEVAGGESFCRHHWLKSQTSVPVELMFVTDKGGAGDEITVKYYKFEGYSNVVEEAYNLYNPSDGPYSLTDNEFPEINYPVTFTVVQSPSEVVFTIYTEDGFVADLLVGGTAYDCASFGFDVDNDGTDDFAILYEPDYSMRWDYSGPPGTGDWGYSDTWDEAHNEWLSGSFVPPEEVGISTENTGTSLIVTISADKLGGLGNTYKFAMNLYKHTGFLGSEQTPDQLWIHAEGELTLGTEIPEGTPFTLPPYERLDFYICYEFAPDIQAGEYVITTKVELAS